MFTDCICKQASEGVDKEPSDKGEGEHDADDVTMGMLKIELTAVIVIGSNRDTDNNSTNR